jgi:hypothetical protein
VTADWIPRMHSCIKRIGGHVEHIMKAQTVFIIFPIVPDILDILCMNFGLFCYLSALGQITPLIVIG